MNHLTSKLTMLSLGLLLALPSCNPDDPCMDETNPDCINYDPCKVEYPEKFEIDILWLNTFTLEDFLPTEDTIHVAPQDLAFKTNFEYDSIFWQIGTDPTIHNENSFSIRFEDNVINSEVLVTARCHRAINTKCFGNNDDGIDTLQQLISFTSWRELVARV
jgi:hypothetical protein